MSETQTSNSQPSSILETIPDSQPSLDSSELHDDDHHTDLIKEDLLCE